MEGGREEGRKERRNEGRKERREGGRKEDSLGSGVLSAAGLRE